MKRLARQVLIVAVGMCTAACGCQGRPEASHLRPGPSESSQSSREREAIEALKALGANIAFDEQGRAKVLRLTGPNVTDAALEHVAALTELRALYLDGTNVTDAGMAHLQPLGKLETLHCVTSITGAKGRRVVETLGMPTVLNYTDVPLGDLLDILADYHQIPFNLDKQALEDADFSPVVPVTAKQGSVRLREALPSILEPLGLVWTIEDGAVVVTTEEALAERRPNLTKLREAVPTLKHVTLDFQAAPEPAGKP
jgi:hypothetical protein